MVSELLLGIGTAMVNPVNISMTVKMYLFPLLDGGQIGPTRSIQINSMGKSGESK